MSFWSPTVDAESVSARLRWQQQAKQELEASYREKAQALGISYETYLARFVRAASW